MSTAMKAIAAAREGKRLERAQTLALAELPALGPLLAAAEELTLEGFGRAVSYSRKVFVPLTQLCRDVCHYCTFAKAPRSLGRAFLSPEQVLEIARAGAAAGCREALFTLGDKPELRYSAARRALAELGHPSTLEYLGAAARLVYEQTGLLPHLNPGVMSRDELERLRSAAVSMGLMLETASERLSERGQPHWGSPDKWPARRLETLEWAGELKIPFTSGLLIGIGETRVERLEALLLLRALHERHGHLQEVIIQNFRAKPGTRMSTAPEPALEEHLWTVAAARLVMGPAFPLQAPPNLQPGALAALVRAGVNDWGGVSPVTPDHVNPEAPWPHLAALARETEAADRELVERLAITPSFARAPDAWVDSGLRAAVRRAADTRGLARNDGWHAGAGDPVPAEVHAWMREALRGTGAAAAQRRSGLSRGIARALVRAARGTALEESDVERLFYAAGRDLHEVIRAADLLREDAVGDEVSYVVNRNINYTNICSYRCGFCAFSKGRSSRDLRGPAYRIDLEEIARRTVEAHEAGATEVCLQGGIHPQYTGQTYLEIAAAVKAAVPEMHVHAFSPLEVTHGARTLSLPLEDFLRRLKAAGLSTLPGTAAEILDDEVRAQICPDKLTTAEWLQVMRAAHAVGLRSTATMMFGHVETPRHWARHLLRLRALQKHTGGFTEFVPLPFVHMEAPMWRKGLARSGAAFREALLVHAVARLVLHPLVPNVQTSWVKMGPEGAALALRAGANDLGGTLMNESITRAAGGVNGQEFDAEHIEQLADSIGRPVFQRTTLYQRARPAAGSPLAAIAH